ncbi:aldehyde dehydrogenase [Nocardia fusca]|uniref:aldehyde dehydrogenase n=1 Tax=Nocardia fusca TaxID=941183 RepID=UPI0037AE205C
MTTVKGRRGFWIDGEFAEPRSTGEIEIYNASTGAPIAVVPEASDADLDAAVSAARRAFDHSGWPGWSAERRRQAMLSLADALEARAEDTAQAVSVQNGMPISLSRRTEAVVPASLLRYYSELVTDPEDEERRPSSRGTTTVIRREPIGVVAAITPWNYPQSLAFFKIAPLLAAGCTVVLKPSPETVLDSYILADAIAASDIPAGVLNIVAGGREIGAQLVAHPGVDKVAFTGSTAAGRMIGEACGRLIRPVTLELGGKSAAVILDDADLEPALQDFFAATLMNNGQTCHLGTRVLAPQHRYRETVDLLTDFARSLQVGDALAASTQIGPLASRAQQRRVRAHIERGIAEGGRVTTGGAEAAGFESGWFVLPTIFDNVANSDTIAREEIFGPVLVVIPYEGEDDAVAMANDSEYGLGGSVWTSDVQRGLDIARRIRTGSLGINHFAIDMASPFGGIKLSGLGRELGPEGLTAYQQTKSIYLRS